MKNSWGIVRVKYASWNENGFFGHPEVKYVGFLTLLYAGTTSPFSFKYSILKDLVKKLKQGSLSAGHILFFGTSETLRNEIIAKNLISVHNPRHMKPQNKVQLGHYLAGLIDGAGLLIDSQLKIPFHDAYLAYFIKREIGYGTVRKIKDSNTFIYILSHKEGLNFLISLINGKIRTTSLHSQFTKLAPIFELKTDNNFDNHWLTGYSDALACFYIPSSNSLNFSLVLPDINLANLLKELWGGDIEVTLDKYKLVTGTDEAKKVIRYFDHYHLLSSKYLCFFKWRKAYILYQFNYLEEKKEKFEKLRQWIDSYNLR